MLILIIHRGIGEPFAIKGPLAAVPCAMARAGAGVLARDGWAR